MPSQKFSLRKKLNKKKKRRLGPLLNKCREYARLPGIELVIIIASKKVGDSNDLKREFRGLMSERGIPWLANIDDIVSAARYGVSVCLV
jgi:Uma2 family endonuclease